MAENFINKFIKITFLENKSVGFYYTIIYYSNYSVLVTSDPEFDLFFFVVIKKNIFICVN